MTFRIANNQIHIGWPQTLTLIGAIVTFVWSTRAYYDDFLKDKQETNARLARIENKLSIKNGIDSMQSISIDALVKGQNTVVGKIDSLGLSFIASHIRPARQRSTGIKFYTERWVNGQLQLTEVKQN